jgi:membrane-bound lytic murein transglycosylase F
LSFHCWPAQFSDAYDEQFQDTALQYLYTYLPDDDWRWWKAQCHQESRLKADAVSPAGAVGVCQLTGGASTDAGILASDRANAKLNIKAGAWILRRGLRTWWRRDDRLEHLKLAWACYNAGCRRIIKAQSLCEGATLWDGISPCLPSVTGLHAAETQHYVDVIPRWYAKILQE